MTVKFNLNKPNFLQVSLELEIFENLSLVLSRFSILGTTITISSFVFIVLVGITNLLFSDVENDEQQIGIGWLLRWVFYPLIHVLMVFV